MVCVIAKIAKFVHVSKIVKIIINSRRVACKNQTLLRITANGNKNSKNNMFQLFAKNLRFLVPYKIRKHHCAIFANGKKNDQNLNEPIFFILHYKKIENL